VRARVKEQVVKEFERNIALQGQVFHWENLIDLRQRPENQNATGHHLGKSQRQHVWKNPDANAIPSKLPFLWRIWTII